MTRKVRLRKLTQLVQGHTVSQWQKKDVKPRSSWAQSPGCLLGQPTLRFAAPDKSDPEPATLQGSLKSLGPFSWSTHVFTPLISGLA